MTETGEQERKTREKKLTMKASIWVREKTEMPLNSRIAQFLSYFCLEGLSWATRSWGIVKRMRAPKISKFGLIRERIGFCLCFLCGKGAALFRTIITYFFRIWRPDFWLAI